MCIALKGRRFAGPVCDAEEAGIITTSTALGYLETKHRHLDEVYSMCGPAWA